MSYLTNYIKLIRPHQWIKNLIVFGPLIFAGQLGFIYDIKLSVVAFVAFCSMASGVYVLNDLFDLESDRAHPKKKMRPIASGKVSPSHARLFALVFMSIGLLLAVMIDINVAYILLAYLAVNIAYSVGLKRVVIVDILIIATGFVLRVMAGAIAISVVVSGWILVTTFFLALFFVIGKRRHELLYLGDDARSHRQTLDNYTTTMLDHFTVMTATASVISFALYTLSPETIARFHTSNLVFTLPFVIYAVFRYYFLIYKKDGGADPSAEIISDVPLLISIILWGFLVIAIIY